MARHPPPPLPRADWLLIARPLSKAAASRSIQCAALLEGEHGRPNGSVHVGAICALAFGDRGLEVGVVDGLGGRGDVRGPRVTREADPKPVVALRRLDQGAAGRRPR